MSKPRRPVFSQRGSYDSKIYQQRMILWGNIENYHFYYININPRVPQLLYVMCKLGVNFVRRRYRHVLPKKTFYHTRSFLWQNLPIFGYTKKNNNKIPCNIIYTFEFKHAYNKTFLTRRIKHVCSTCMYKILKTGLHYI